MKTFIFFSLLLISITVNSQQKQLPVPELNQGYITTQPDGNAIFIEVNSTGKTHTLPTDNMPCFFPSLNDVVAVPNGKLKHLISVPIRKAQIPSFPFTNKPKPNFTEKLYLPKGLPKYKL